MDAEQQLLLDLHAAAAQSQADNFRAAFPALVEINQMVGALLAVKYLALRKGGLAVDEALSLCKG